MNYNTRKHDHLRLYNCTGYENSLEKIRIDYYSIPEFSIDEISLETTVGGIKWKYPFFINSITAGYDLDDINRDFYEICKKEEIMFFAGSISPFLKSNKYEKYISDSVNIGLDKNPKYLYNILDSVNPKYIQLHANLIQEIVMPEGDKNFGEWLCNLEDIVKNVNIPIIFKETGFGINDYTINKVIELGIKVIDISSKGGTDFSAIENKRRELQNIRKIDYFDEIGYNLFESLKIAEKYKNDIDILASGGISSPLDVVKSLAFGAKAVGVSRYFLDILLNKGSDELHREIKEWKTELKYLYLITNSRTTSDLYGKVRVLNECKCFE